MTAYLSLAKAQKSVIDAIVEQASALWKASTFYSLNPQAAQEYLRKKRLEIEEDIILHGGEEVIALGGGTPEQLAEVVSIPLPAITPPPTPPPTEKPAAAAMAALAAIPKLVIPLPENVRILFEKPVENLATSLATSPAAVMEYSRQNLVDAAMRMVESSREMLKMASQIAVARSTGTPITVDGLTVTPEKALDMLRNAYLSGYNILISFLESITTLTEYVPLTADEEAKIIDAVTEITANLTAIRQLAQQPPKTLPPLKLKTIYGYDYICPVCGSTYFTQSEAEAHMRAVGHGKV